MYESCKFLNCNDSAHDEERCRRFVIDFNTHTHTHRPDARGSAAGHDLKYKTIKIIFKKIDFVL